MATHTIHDLKQLPDDDSWELFRRRAFVQRAEEPANLVKIGKDIIKRCGGLPLAIATLGSMMHLEDDEEKWKVVLGSEIWEMQAAKDNILLALRLSYNYLPSHLKQCFAFCAIYPKDYEMEKDEMIQMWMANGFIPSDGKRDLDAVGRDIFDELVWRCFFQNVEERPRKGPFTIFFGSLEPRPREGLFNIDMVYFKIHDLMHDLAQSIMGKDCLNFTCSFNWKDIPSTTKHVSIASIPYSSSYNRSVFPTIRTITKFERDFSIHEIELSSKFTSKFKTLRVLNNLALHKLRVGDLRHLRMLDLSYSDIGEMPKGICSLYNLQTLNLSGCDNLKKLPDNLTDLVNLRHLHIDGCDRLICMPRGMRHLKQLQILTKYIVGAESERGIEQLRDMNLGGVLHLSNIENVSNAFNAEDLSLSSKQNLHSIILSWEGVCSLEVFEALKPNDKLKMLYVLEYKGWQFPKWMNDPQQLQNMVHVKLVGCEKCKELPPLEQLPFLEFLTLGGMDEVNHIISKTIWCNGELHTTLFPSLKEFYMYNMKNLEGFWESEESNAQVLPDSRQLFPCLTHLSINKCCNLKTVHITGLVRLQELKLQYCDGLASLPEGMESIINLQIDRCNSLASLPEGMESLIDLHIEGCNGLVSLPEGMKSLISLNIKNCFRLRSLPEVLLLQLPNLAKLVIIGHDELIRPFQSGGDYRHLIEKIPVVNVIQYNLNVWL